MKVGVNSLLTRVKEILVAVVLGGQVSVSFRSVLSKGLGASMRLFENPLVEVAGIIYIIYLQSVIHKIYVFHLQFIHSIK